MLQRKSGVDVIQPNMIGGSSHRTKSGTFARHTKPTHKSQPCKRACLVPTLPGTHPK